MTDVTPRYTRLQNAAHRLNAEAYALQAARGKIKRFVPCPRASVLIAACRTDQHMALVEIDAINTWCDCHPSLLMPELIDMEFDPTWRLHHYREEAA